MYRDAEEIEREKEWLVCGTGTSGTFRNSLCMTRCLCCTVQKVVGWDPFVLLSSPSSGLSHPWGGGGLALTHLRLLNARQEHKPSPEMYPCSLRAGVSNTLGPEAAQRSGGGSGGICLHSPPPPSAKPRALRSHAAPLWCSG